MLFSYLFTSKCLATMAMIGFYGHPENTNFQSKFLLKGANCRQKLIRLRNYWKTLRWLERHCLLLWVHFMNQLTKVVLNMESYLLSKGLYHFFRIFLPGENFHTHILQQNGTQKDETNNQKWTETSHSCNKETTEHTEPYHRAWYTVPQEPVQIDPTKQKLLALV